MIGKVHKYGDHIDTDVIIPARYCNTIESTFLAAHCLEDLDREFVNRVNRGDILVAGENFGCGSSREVAPLAIQHAGVSCVVAKSFARIFYRNAINVGLPIVECSTFVEEVSDGDEVEILEREGLILNRTSQKKYTYSTDRMGVAAEIIERGGLVEYVRSKLAAKEH